MNSIPLEKIFNYQGHELKVIIHNDKPAIIGNELCAALGYKNPRQALSKLPDHQKDDVPILDAIGRSQNTKIVYEGGWYRLAFGSHLPNAEAFTDLVTDEILPSIRKTGKYEIPPVADAVTHIPITNSHLNMTEEQKINALREQIDIIRNIVYSARPEERHLRMMINCFYAFGVLNDVHIPREDRDQFLIELLQIRLQLQEKETHCINYEQIERQIQTFIDTSIKALVVRLR